MKYINVVIDNKSDNTDTFYTYGCENEDIKVGQKVYVPFNKGNRIKDAYVFQVKDTLEAEIKNLKYVDDIDCNVSLNEESINTCVWMKKRYLCRYIDAVKCFTPMGTKSKQGKKRDPLKDRKGELQDIRALTGEQNVAVKTICKDMRSDNGGRFLIHGVTGSGKTEVYMRVIADAVNMGKTAIMLVPEISLTKQIIDRFIGRFGNEKIAVLHSRLSLGERYDQWIRIKEGDVKIVIGARSAVFAPLENIGVIAIDEEHETTYKSDMTPKYETVEVAIKRLNYYKGTLILGSATPSVTSYYRGLNDIYEILTLKERYNKTPLPAVKITDMRTELKDGNKTMISKDLYKEMKEQLKEGKQVILFLNRRGYSTFISCRECGDVMVCPTCGISLTYHKSDETARCHYCGYETTVPKKCSSCGSKYIRYFGTGTEQVEEVIKDQFPDQTVARLDLDTTRRKGSIEKILREFKNGKTKIMIGTQLVAKGLDFKNVGLVGIVSADVSLNIPDFRSSERTFQLITQAAGRAGRGEERGKVIIQSYSPENYAVKYAAAQDYEGFYKSEIQLRRYMDYPPFSDLIQLVFSSGNDEKARAVSESWSGALKKRLGDKDGENVFKPCPAHLNKIKDKYRYCMLIKCPMGQRNRYLNIVNGIKESQIKIRKKGYNVSIDINPYSFA